MASFVLPPATLIAACDSTTAQFIPCTQWVPAIGVKRLLAVIEVNNVTTGVGTAFRILPCFQRADWDPSRPDAYQSITLTGWTELQGNGRKLYPLVDITAIGATGDEIRDSYWVRFGFYVKRSTGSTYAQGEVTAYFSGSST